MPVGKSFRKIVLGPGVPEIKTKKKVWRVRRNPTHEIEHGLAPGRTRSGRRKLDRMAEKMQRLGMEGWEFLTEEDLKWAPKRWFYPRDLPPPTDREFYKEHMSPSDYPPGFLPPTQSNKERVRKRRSMRATNPCLGCKPMKIPET
jgi:hypothetical protein